MEELFEDITQVFTPAFVVDLDIVERNCTKFLQFYNKKNIKLRPHMKTHKTLEIGKLMTGGSKRGIAVSTLKEAEFYADGGFDDIFFASPVILNRIPRLKKLIDRVDQFHVMVDNETGLKVLLENPLDNRKWSIFVAIDTGYGREGLAWNSQATVDFVRRILQAGNTMELKAFYSHCGNSYESSNETMIAAVASEAVNHMMFAVTRIKEETTWKGDLWGIGSTPTCSKPPDCIEQMREVHPGNYVFNDFMQVNIGSCLMSDVAGKVITSIVSHKKEKNLLLIDCGFTGLTVQSNGELPQGFCHIQGHPNLKLIGMTQELGKVTSIEGELDFEKHPVGSKLTFVPFHSCATAAMYPFYWMHRNGKIVAKYEPCRGF